MSNIEWILRNTGIVDIISHSAITIIILLWYNDNVENRREIMIQLIDPKNTYIDDSVKLGENCIIHPNVMIKGNTVIGDNTVIYMGSYIEDSIIGKNNTIYTSYIINSEIGDDNIIGPYANIRPGNHIANQNKIGSFVELKNNDIKNNIKIPHLSYVGDTSIDNHVNIGAGVKVANYDGKEKYRTTIHENVFVGCNSVLVAPVTLCSGSYVAAGSVITNDVPENLLAIARERQININK